MSEDPCRDPASEARDDWAEIEHAARKDAISDWDVVHAMTAYGGSFVEALAKAWTAGNSINRAIIQNSWPEYWKKYREFARTCKKLAPRDLQKNLG